jgi:flagellar biosynthesis/type III secretory pathway chaperone
VTDDTQLLRLLEAELTTLQSLADALEAEHRALVDGEVPGIEAATAVKAAAAEAHQAQQRQRLEWMRAAGLEDKAPLAESVARLKAGGEPALASAGDLAAVQGRLAELATRCQARNRHNGALILRLQERARGALDVLRGADTRGDIYSLSGAREPSADSRSLGKA